MVIDNLLNVIRLTKSMEKPRGILPDTILHELLIPLKEEGTFKNLSSRVEWVA